MGYYTSYSIELCKLNGDDLDDAIHMGLIKEIRDTYPDTKNAIQEDGSYEDVTKWYSWKENMLEFSLKHPDVRFTVDGHGDNSDDVWAADFVNGKVHHRYAEIAPFDESKLI